MSVVYMLYIGTSDSLLVTYSADQTNPYDWLIDWLIDSVQ